MPSHRKGEEKRAVYPSSSEGQFRGGRSLEYDSNDWDHPPKGSDFARVPGTREYPRAPLSEGGIDTSDSTRRVNRGYQEASQYGSTSLLSDGNNGAVIPTRPRAMTGTSGPKQGGIRENRFGWAEPAYNGPPPQNNYRQRSPPRGREDQPRRGREDQRRRSRSLHRRALSPYRPPHRDRRSARPSQNYRGPRPQASAHTKNAHTGDGNIVPRGPRKRFRSQSPLPPYRERNPNFLDCPPWRRNHTRGSHQRHQWYSRTPHTNRPRSQMNSREFNPRHSHSQPNPRGAFRLAPYGQNRDARERFGGNSQMGLGGGRRGSEDRGLASHALGMPASSELVPQTIQELHQEDSEIPQETGWNETPEHSPE